MQTHVPGQQEAAQPGITGSRPHFTKRRRIALACTLCRQKKSRCDGTRPTCSGCHKLDLECSYEEPSPSGATAKKGSTQPTYTELAEKVKELEARLSSMPAATSSPVTCTSDGPLLSDNLGIDEESAVDALATNAFDDVPERDIGYFGPSSNHALFRSLSASFAHHIPVLSHSQQPTIPPGDGHEQIPSHVNEHPAWPPNLIRGRARFPSQQAGLVEPFRLPTEQEISYFVNRFFSGVGLVLPYVDKSCLLLEGGQSGSKALWETSRAGRALLNIICAHAALTIPSADAEVFYQRTLALLNDRALRGANLELTQTLLLLCSFQQNTQRSIASWTYHALTVKTTLQLGLHSPASYEELGLQKRELRRWVWYAVVNQDRHLGLALGRPFLVSGIMSRMEIPFDHLCTSDTMTGLSRSRPDSLTYFYHLTALSGIRSTMPERLYNNNNGDRPRDVNAQAIVVRRLELIGELDNWRRSCASSCSILCFADMDGWTLSTFHVQRFRILLSIQYYSLHLVINGPVLTSYLLRCEPKKVSTSAPPALVDVESLAISDDFIAARELQQIVRRLVESAPGFVDCYAAWWICNYYMFTVCLHLFGILVICQVGGLLPCHKSLETTLVRDVLNAALETLKAVERTSLMSWKGRHCLERFLHVLDSLATQRPTALGVPMGEDLQVPSSAEFEDLYSQVVTQSANDFMLQSTQLGFLDADLNFDF